MIKVIAFDFGNVIYKLHHRKFIKNLKKYSKLSYSKLFDEILNSKEYDLLETGKISFNEYFKAIQYKAKLKATKEKLTEEIKEKLTEIRSSLDIILKLKKKYKLILVSNANEIDFNYVIRKSKAFKYFDEYIISYKLGYMKPSFMIYLELIRLADCNPDEILFIDDKNKNIKGAAKLGIKAIQYKNYSKLLKDLKKYKVKL